MNAAELLSLLGLRTAGEDEELAATERAWRGTYDLERTRAGWRAYSLLEVREPVTGRTLARLRAAMMADHAAGGAR